MADGGNKAALLLALGGKPKAGGGGMPGPEIEIEAEPESEGLPGAGEIKSTAAADAMAAFKSGDVAGLEDALTRFVEACSSEGYEK